MSSSGFGKMMGLLENAFAPVTLTIGFIDAPFPIVCDAFIAWQETIGRKFRTIRLRDGLPRALGQLEPLADPQDRELLLETGSPWTALFNNGLRASDVTSPVGYLCKRLECRGLGINCVPDRATLAGRGLLRPYGSIQFELFGPQSTEWLNRQRLISAMNDGGEWVFTAEGTVQPFENIEFYRARRIRDRFTPEMLESYCAALGIRLFDASFYGLEGLLVKFSFPTPSGVKGMSFQEAQGLLSLE